MVERSAIGIAITELENLASHLFPEYITRNSVRAGKEAASMHTKIMDLVGGAEACDWNYLLLICRSAPKYQILPNIGQADWENLRADERDYARHLYLLSALHCDYQTRASMFELVIKRWEMGLPLWGAAYSNFESWAGVCRLTHALDKSRPMTEVESSRLEQVDPVMSWWMRADRLGAINFLTRQQYGWPRRFDNRYFVINVDERGIGWLSRKFSAERLVPTSASSRRLRVAATTYLGAIWPPTCEVDYTKMGTHPRFLFEVWLGVADWRPEATGANAKSWTTEMLMAFDAVLSRCPVGTPEPMAMHVALLGLDNKAAGPLIEYATEQELWNLPSTQRAEAFKIVSTCVRAYGRLPGCDGRLSGDELLASMGWEFGRGRYTMHSDRKKELKERSLATRHLRVDEIFTNSARMNPEGEFGHHSPDPNFYMMLRDELLDIAAEVISPHNIKRTIKDHLLERHEWLASGSARNSGVSIDGEVYRGNKRTVGEQLSCEELYQRIVHAWPSEHGTGSEKHENDKARLLLSVPEEHYYITSIVTCGVETRLHRVPGIEKGLTGLDKMMCEIRKVYDSHGARTVMDADYANFNIQHTPEAMRAVFEAFMKVGQQMGASSDWLWCVNWVIKSTELRSFDFIGCLGHDATRATDIYNTIINRAYFGVALKVRQSHFGVIPSGMYNVHQGDDIHMSCVNVSAAVGVWLVLRLMGLDMQKHKQLLGAGCAEFLRVVYVGGRGRGIPARALINLLLKPLQSSDGDEPLETIPAVFDTIQVLRRRGLSLVACQVLYEDQLRLCSRISLKARDYGAPTVPLALIYGNRLQGGFGMPPPGYRPIELTKRYVIPHLGTEFPAGVFNKLPYNMAKDWVRSLSRRVGRVEIDAEALRTTAASANYSGVLRQAFRARTRRMRFKSWCRFLKDNPELQQVSPPQHMKRLLQPHGDMATELAWAREGIKSSQEAGHRIRGYLDWLGASVSLQVAKLEQQAILRLNNRDVSGHSTMNGQIQASMASTTFKSLKTTLTAFGGDVKASITHIIQCLSRDSGKKSSVALNALTSAPANLAVRVLGESIGERMLCLEYMLGCCNPDLVAECSDNAMDTLWPRVKDMSNEQLADIRWLHVYSGLCVIDNILHSYERVMCDLNLLLH